MKKIIECFIVTGICVALGACSIQEVSDTTEKIKKESEVDGEIHTNEVIEDLPEGNYTREFHDTIAKMKECYTLKDYKGVDLDQLEKKYEYLFISADASADQVDAFFAWNAFCNAIPDGHVYVCGKNTEEHNKLRTEMLHRYMGYDYGFVCMRNVDRRIVFVSVDDTSEAYNMGIRQGMELTAMNGIEVEEAIGNESMIAKYSDNTNRSIMLPIYLTCQYGDKLTITYSDFDKNEHTVDLIGNGRYYDRFKKINSLLHPNRDWEKEYEVKMLEDEIGYLAIHTVFIKSSNDFNNAGSYDKLRDDLTREIKRLKNDGAKKLIVDLRDNGGGYAEVSMTIASLFSDDEIFCAKLDGPEETIHQVSGVIEQKIMPYNVWGDGDVLVLVNDNTASGAELLEYALRKLPNVKTIGMTNSCGCAMGTFGLNLKDFSMSYPSINYIDENDEIIIDADSAGDMKIPVDIRIPLDDTAIKRIFTDGEDYCLEYAIEQIR